MTEKKKAIEETDPGPTTDTTPDLTTDPEPTPIREPMNEREIMRMLQIADGQNPDAQQTINDFMRFNNDVERTNLPTTNAVLCVAQLGLASKWLYPENEDNPFAIVERSLAIAFMARKGEKSSQFVDIVRNQPDLSQYQTAGEDMKNGLVDRVLNRSVAE